MSRWSRANKAVRAELPKGSRVLDVGAARGFGTSSLAGDYALHSVDVKPAEISKAGKGLSSRAVASATALPFAAQSFDGLLCLDVLEHIPDASAVVAEISRVLRPGGLLVLTVPNRGVLRKLDSYNLGVATSIRVR
ncbi:MAG: class I SAM-dependent methyltransferase [Dehalococcoidia bacterium]